MDETKREAIERALKAEHVTAKRQVLLKRLWKLNQPATLTGESSPRPRKKEGGKRKHTLRCRTQPGHSESDPVAPTPILPSRYTLSQYERQHSHHDIARLGNV